VLTKCFASLPRGWRPTYPVPAVSAGRTQRYSPRGRPQLPPALGPFLERGYLPATEAAICHFHFALAFVSGGPRSFPCEPLGLEALAAQKRRPQLGGEPGPQDASMPKTASAYPLGSMQIGSR
jgi:hypothetical protein